MTNKQLKENEKPYAANDCRIAALKYAGQGWQVFPADSAGAKKSHKSAAASNGAKWGMTTDQQQIRVDFNRWPDANVGIVTGAESGLFVIDVDTLEGHSVDGKSALRQLEERNSALPSTLMAESPTGSVHYYFRWPSNIVIGNSTSKIANGVDVRGEGGMVIAPPSVRPGKGKYKWLNNHAVAEAPNWLIELCTAGDNKNGQPGEPTAEIEEIAEALRIIPNDDEDWEEWNKIGMATFAASKGSEAGYDSFAEWSRKSDKYDAAETREKWEHFYAHPPTKIGAGTLFRMANLAKPGWRAVPETHQVDFLQNNKAIVNFEEWIAEHYGNDGDGDPPRIPSIPEQQQSKPASGGVRANSVEAGVVAP
jgi:Bifunctional DNA primase/polymerase, N-terminal/Primase C terminal 2 (PriCT-2)